MQMNQMQVVPPPSVTGGTRCLADGDGLGLGITVTTVPPPPIDVVGVGVGFGGAMRSTFGRAE